MDRRELVGRLAALPFDRGEYWLVAGGAMILYGLREQTADLDLGCSAAMADRLEASGCPCRLTESGKRCFRYEDDVEIFEDWLRGRVETLEGFPVVSLEGLLEMKRELGREKDRQDIARILAALGGKAE